MSKRSVLLAIAAGLPLIAVSTARAENTDRPAMATEADDGSVHAGDQVFESWQAYFSSDFFKENGSRCGTVIDENSAPAPHGGSASDCTYNFTNPSSVYAPSVGMLRIPVVVHVIRNSSGSSGNISQTMVESQIDILNEDYLALPGSNGQNGIDGEIEFFLATEDPDGNPTNGITYSNNTTWFNDGGGYYNTLAWDTNNYLNIYTNTAGGALGYVPDLPQGGITGSNADRVVCNYQAFGRNSPLYPYHQGRTCTHEVGHYLGLYHTFDNGCGTISGCYSSNDRICDTPRQSSPNYGCGNGGSCGSTDDYHNYMDYTDDLCMTHFTSEQIRRMRCSMEHYRPDLNQPEVILDGACCLTFGCIVVAEDVCNLNSGAFEGVGTACSPNPCPDTCPTVTGDINGDGSIAGDDVGGYVRAKMGTPPQSGENQACADYGTGTITGDNALFVSDLLN